MAAVPSLEPVLKALEEGRVIRSWVSIALKVCAVLAVIGGLVGAYRALKGLSESGQTGAGLLLALLMVVAVVMMAQILWYRAGTVAKLPDSRFTVIPIFSQLLRSAGEIYAAFAAVFGVGGMIFMWVAKQSPLGMIGGFATWLPRAAAGIESSFVGGILFLIYMAVVGFFALVLFYAAAEASIAIVAIAQNTERR
ncbi:MAG TPA: hypothetical protein VEH83_07425 [Gemmatimonadales bacterium]|nr:hypothetical protein [Gemmatimonadales bacterium]